MYQTLYRAYRPQYFRDVVGQPHIVTALQAALKQQQVAHAYLFTGPRGTGKTTVGRLLAKAVNCLKTTADDSICGQCPACQSIAAGTNLDVVEIDAASNRGIDDIRALKERILFPPQDLRRKVYIIDEVHMLTSEAFNALLKTLEEPPDHALFVMATTEPHKVPVTIQSRCQRLDFHRGSSRDLTDYLNTVAKKEGFALEAEAARLIADLAEGGFRDALTLLERVRHEPSPVTLERVRALLGLGDAEIVHQLLDQLLAGDRAAVFNTLAALEEKGMHPPLVAHSIVWQLRRVLYVLAGAAAPRDSWEAATADRLTLPEARRLTELFMRAATDGRALPMPLFALEVAAATWLDDRPSTVSAQAASSEAVPAATAPTATAPAGRAPKIITAAPTTASTAASTDVPPASPPAAPPVTLDSKQWREIVQSLAPANHSISQLLQMAAAGPLQNDTLPIYVPYPFHVETLKQKANFELIASAVERVLSRPLAPEFFVGEPPKEAVRLIGSSERATDLVASINDVFTKNQ